MLKKIDKLSKCFCVTAFGLLVVFVLSIEFGNCGTVLASQSKKADPNSSVSDPNEKPKEVKKAPRPEHTHPAFNERVKERKRMVERQIRIRGVRDPNVLAAMTAVPRHKFVRRGDQGRAYGDHPIPIGVGQTISQPYIVGYMTDILELTSDANVLEIGTGSGYQAAVCAEIAKEVYTIEIIEQLADSAKKQLKELGYVNVFARAGDGYYGWEEKGPFDAIIITAASPMMPPPLIKQLKAGGRMILPLGSPYGAQTLVLITKDKDGKIRSKGLLPVRFVPMVGHVQKSN